MKQRAFLLWVLLAGVLPVWADLAFSGDGSRLYVSDSTHLRVHDVASGRRRARISRVRDIQLAVRGQSVVIWWHKTAEQLDPTPLKVRARLFESGGYLEEVALNDQGKVTAWADYISGADMMASVHAPGELPTGEPGYLFGATGDLALSSDGKRLAWGGQESPLRLWDLVTDKLLHIVPDEGAYRQLLFTPDGTSLLALRGDSLTCLAVSDGATRYRLPPGAHGWPNQMAWLQDRLLVGWSDGSLTLHDRDSGSQLSQFSRLKASLQELAVSSDGRLVATRDEKNRVVLWNAAGKRLREFSQ